MKYFVDFDKSKQKDFKQMDVMVSTVPINLEEGTPGSIEFLKETADMNDEAFYTKFSNFIEYKWQKD